MQGVPHPKIQVELSTELNFFQDGGTPRQKKRLLEGVDTAHTFLMGGNNWGGAKPYTRKGGGHHTTHNLLLREQLRWVNRTKLKENNRCGGVGGWSLLHNIATS